MAPASALSARTGLAVAAAIAGLVLAGGVSAAALFGWIGPAQSSTGRDAPADAPALSTTPVEVSSTQPTPQVIFVPVAPAARPAEGARELEVRQHTQPAAVAASDRIARTADHVVRGHEDDD